MRCHSYEQGEVEAQVRAAVDQLGGFAAYVKPGEKVLVKPNLLVGAAPERAISTHPAVMRAVIRGCQEAGTEVWVGDSSGFGNSRANAAQSGIIAVCEETGARFTPFDTVREVPFPDGKIAKRFLLGEPVVTADKVISVAKFKTHGLMMYTGAVKNLYGTIAGREKTRLHLSYQNGRDFGAMLLDLYRLVRPALSIVDAVVGMEGDGPRNGTPRQVGLILAGSDGVAVDTVGAALIGLAPHNVPYLACAAEMGLATDLSQIEIAGVSLSEARVQGFKLPPVGDGRPVPAWLGDFGRKLVTARPIVDAARCAACGACRQNCPPGAIRLENHRAVIDDDKCIRCYCCQEICPHAAIELRRGLMASILRW